MANAQNSQSIYILNRNNYNTFVEDRRCGNNIFFVRENSSESSNIISLYVGESKQCDLLDVTKLCEVEKTDSSISDNTLSSCPIVPNTVQLGTLSGETLTSMYVDDGHGLIVNSSNPLDLSGTINYLTGVITYNSGKQQAPDAKYVYSTFNQDNPQEMLSNEFKIPNKMFFYKQVLDAQGSILAQPYYRVLMWNDDLNQFLNCSPKELVLENGTLATIGKNIISGTDMPLASIIDVDSTTPSGSIELACLPRNGAESRYMNSDGITTIQIDNIENMYYYQGSENPTLVPVTSDYISVIIFKRKLDGESVIDDVQDLMTNFKAQNNVPKIYLLNPDIDISEFTVIHILIYNDGFHICAIVAGYNENAE